MMLVRLWLMLKNLCHVLDTWKLNTSPFQNRCPSRCKHSNILKNILVHCRALSFTLRYLHVRAHQDNATPFKKLSRKAQLNCICDHTAKQRIAIDGTEGSTAGRMFPLEPIGMFVQGGKLTSDTGDTLRFWAHRQLARK
jgi:hypothetical protein